MFLQLFTPTPPVHRGTTQAAMIKSAQQLAPLYESLKRLLKYKQTQAAEQVLTAVQCLLASTPALTTHYDDTQSPRCLKQLKTWLAYTQSLVNLLEYQQQLNQLYSDCAKALNYPGAHPLLNVLGQQQARIKTIVESALNDKDSRLLLWLHEMPVDGRRLTELENVLALLASLQAYQQQGERLREQGHERAFKAVDWQVTHLEDAMAIYAQSILLNERPSAQPRRQIDIDVKAILGRPQLIPVSMQPSSEDWIREGYRQREVIHQHRGFLWSWVQALESCMNKILEALADLPILTDWIARPSVSLTPQTHTVQCADEMEALTEQTLKRAPR